MWIIAPITLSSDVRPAALDAAGRHTGWEEAAAWAESRVGRPVALVLAHDALAWRADEGAGRADQAALGRIACVSGPARRPRGNLAKAPHDPGMAG
jgi:hypothetical protein